MKKLPMLFIEDIEEILSYVVEPWGSPKNLNYLLVSKKVYAAALPLTVKTFNNPVGGHGRLTAVKYRSRNARFLCYILIHKPELARKVQTIAMESMDHELCFLAALYQYTDEQLGIFREWLMGHGIPSGHAHKWIMHVKRGYSDAQLALMLLACPGLRELSYDAARGERDTHVQYVMERAQGSLTFALPGCNPPLHRLQHISISTRAPVSFENWDHKADKISSRLFTLPQLSLFAGLNLIGTNVMAAQFDRLPPRSSSVEVISLMKSCLSSRMLTTMVESCRKIRSFTLVSGMWISCHQLVVEAFPQDVIRAMLPHADTLECLHVEVTRAREDKNAKLSEKLFLGPDLAQLRKLKRLTTDAESLVAHALTATNRVFNGVHTPNVPGNLVVIPSMRECLPRALEYLEIHNCTWEIQDSLQQLLFEVGPGRRFPRLLRVRLCFNNIGERPVHLWTDASVKLEFYFNS